MSKPNSEPVSNAPFPALTSLKDGLRVGSIRSKSFSPLSCFQSECFITQQKGNLNTSLKISLADMNTCQSNLGSFSIEALSDDSRL